MTENEWSTIKILMSMEHQKIIKRFGTSTEALNYAFFQWIDKVQRHIHITAEKEPVSPQMNEIVSGFAELIENNPLTDEEMEILKRMFQALRGTA